MSKYLEQYERMKRMYDRFDKTSFWGAGLSGQSLKDDGLAFFQACLHLRDWIKNDEELPQTVRDAAIPYFNASKTLPLCYDIAIAAKHLIVDWPKVDKNARLKPIRTVIEERSAEMPNGSGEDDNPLPPGTPVHIQSVWLLLETHRGERGALEFASECIKEWDNFFKLYGLT